MLGKQKCRILKEIRQRIANENDIPWITSECRHQGECRGTCPKCESELRELERQLAARQAAGKRVAVAALCAGLAFSSVGCTRDGGLCTAPPSGDPRPVSTPSPEPEPLMGEIAVAGEIPEAAEEPPLELDGYIAWPEDGELMGEPVPEDCPHD